MTADWPQIDAAAVSASSDLFGGDLFGDELMDMYNSSAVVGSDGADHGAIDSISGKFCFYILLFRCMKDGLNGRFHYVPNRSSHT